MVSGIRVYQVCAQPIVVTVKQSATKHLQEKDAVFVIDAKLIVDDPTAARCRVRGRWQAALAARSAPEIAKGDVGAGGLVELNIDGKPIATTK